MSEDLNGINYLGGLQGRVVRNAKPGNKNNPNAGLLHVSTDSFVDNHTLKDYFLQAYPADNIVSIAETTFTKGSITVSTASSFAGLSVGDYIRPHGGGELYRITNLGTLTLTLDEPFSGDTTTTEAESHSLDFGRVSFRSVENYNGSTGSGFSFSQEKDLWLADPGNNVSPPVTTGSDGSKVGFKEGISLYSITEDSETPDMSIVGIVDKYLPLTPSDTNMVPFTPVPYPSDLSAPRDASLSNLSVYIKKPDDMSYTEMTLGEGFLLSYTLNPVYDGYRPLSDEARNANIHLLDTFTVAHNVEEGFSGLVSLKAGFNYVTNIYEDSLRGFKVESGTETELVPKKDFLVNPLSGSTLTIGHEDLESPVDQVFSFLDAFPNGLSVKESRVPLEDATEDDFANATTLLEGKDFSVNENNGGFLLLKQVPPNSCVRVEYLVRGATLDSVYVLENANDFRLDYFPVMANTVKASATDGKNSRKLVEGLDFHLFYSNGIIRVSEEVSKWANRISFQYAPATKVVCYASPRDGNETKFKFVNTAVPVASPRLIKIPIPGKDITITKLTAHDGTSLSLNKIKEVGGGTFDLGTPSNKLVERTFGFADFYVTASNLAYAPLVRLRKKLPAGTTSFDLENEQAGSLPFGEDTVLMFKSADPSFVEYAFVDSVVDLDGVNSSVVLRSPLTAEVNTPQLFYTDGQVSFTNVVGSWESFGRGAATLTFGSVLGPDLKPGVLMNLGGKQVVSVTGVTVNGSGTVVGIKPQARVMSPEVSYIGVTDKPVYSEGDTGLAMRYPLMGFGAPVMRLEDTSDQSREIRYEVSLTGNNLKLTRREALTEDVEYELDTGDYTNMTDMANAIQTITSGEVSYTAIRDLDYINPASLVGTEASFNPIQIPMDLRAKESVRKSINGGPFEILSRGDAPGEGDYNILGGVIVLNDTIKKGDRFRVTYTHAHSLGLSAGDSIRVEGRKFVPIPKGTSIRVVTDYLSQDQHMIQSETEEGFLGDFFFPYWEAQKKASRGQVSTGSRGIEASASSGVAQGGVYNNLMQLRDHRVATEVLWKIADYYKYRMGSFSAEHSGLKGTRYGNNDFRSGNPLTDRMSSFSDVEHQAALHSSVFYPDDYRSNTPKKDGRFSREYSSYDSVYPFNSNGVGYLYGQHSNFLSGSRDLKPGDTIKVGGYAEEFTLVSVVDDTLLALDKEVPNAPVSVPSFIAENTGGFYGVPYKVIRDGRVSSFVDDKGCAGSVAVSPRQGSFVVYESDPTSKQFRIETSTDGGLSWATAVYTIDVSALSLVPQFISLDRMAQLLYDQMSSDFIVKMETVYNLPNYSSEVEKALSIEWPFPVPDVDEVSAKRQALVIRSRTAGVWMRFNEVGGIDLGFPQGLVFESNFRPGNCVSALQGEVSSRGVESAHIGTILDEDNKLSRGATGLIYPLRPMVANSLAASTNHEFGLGLASEGARNIMEETNVQPAYDEAEVALGSYMGYLAETQIAVSNDHTFSSVANSLNVNAQINDVQTPVLLRSDVNNVLAGNLEAYGSAFIDFEAPQGAANDGRVLFGDKTKNPSVPIGNNYGLVQVFPAYLKNQNYKGFFEAHPRGWWDTSAPAYGYSSGQTFRFHMSPCFTITSTEASATMSSNEDQLVIFDGVATHTVPFRPFPTLSILKVEVDSIPGVTMTITSGANESYGTIVPRNTVSLYNTDVSMYYGSRGDLYYYTLSDAVLKNRIEASLARVSELGEYGTFYAARVAQVQAAFEGEELALNREKWLGFNLHRVFGPANKVLPLKKMMGGV